jgi:hypothetical protein
MALHRFDAKRRMAFAIVKPQTTAPVVHERHGYAQTRFPGGFAAVCTIATVLAIADWMLKLM